MILDKVNSKANSKIKVRILISSILLAVLSYFYIFSFASILSPTIYPLIDRVVYSTDFVNQYFFSQYIDSILIITLSLIWFQLAIHYRFKILIILGFVVVFLISFTINDILLFQVLTVVISPSLFFLSIILQKFKNSLLLFEKEISIRTFAVIGILLSIFSLTITLTSVFYPSGSLPSVNYLYYIYLLLSSASPLIVLSIIISVPTKIIIDIKNKNKPNTKNLFNHLNKSSRLSTKKRAVLLLSVIILSVLVSLIPHIYLINPDNQPIGADTKDYSRLLESLKDEQSMFLISVERVTDQFRLDRPISLLIFFYYTQAFHTLTTSDAIDHLPIILGPALVIVVFYLTREITSNDVISITASFLTIVSFHFLIGIYSGFYANWLSLIFSYLALYFVIKYIKNPHVLYLVAFSAAMIISFFTHSSNWTIMFLVMVIYLTALFVLRLEKRKSVIFLYLGLIPSVLIEITKTIFFEFSGVIGDISFAEDRINTSTSLMTIWENLVDTLHINLGGIYANSIIFLLILFWLYHTKIKDKFVILIVVFLLLPAIPILIADTDLQSRVLFEIPFQVPAAVGLYYLKFKYGSLIFAMTSMWLLVISIRVVFNLHFSVL